jgi:hypothetical protein
MAPAFIALTLVATTGLLTFGVGEAFDETHLRLLLA